MTTNLELDKKLDHVAGKLEYFISTYETDMRGDKDLNNGNLGMVGEIREIKKHLKEYPSITYLLRKKFVATAGVILLLLFLFHIAASSGVIPWVLNLLGIKWPV